MDSASEPSARALRDRRCRPRRARRRVAAGRDVRRRRVGRRAARCRSAGRRAAPARGALSSRSRSGGSPRPRSAAPGAVLVGSLVLLVAWTGVTVWWSIVARSELGRLQQERRVRGLPRAGLRARGGRPCDRSPARSSDALHRHRYDARVGARHEGRARARGGRARRAPQRAGRSLERARAPRRRRDRARALARRPRVDASTRCCGSPAHCSSTSRRSRCMLTLSRAGVVVGVGVLALWLALSTRACPERPRCSSRPPGRRFSYRGVGLHAPRADRGSRASLGPRRRRRGLRRSRARRRGRRRRARRRSACDARSTTRRGEGSAAAPRGRRGRSRRRRGRGERRSRPLTRSRRAATAPRS